MGAPLLEEVVRLCASSDTLEAGDAGAERVLSAALGTVDAALITSLSEPQQHRLLVALAALTAKGSSEAARDAARAATARLELTPVAVLPLLAAPLGGSSGGARKTSTAKTPAKRSKTDSGKAGATVAVDALDGEALQRCVGGAGGAVTLTMLLSWCTRAGQRGALHSLVLFLVPALKGPPPRRRDEMPKVQTTMSRHCPSAFLCEKGGGNHAPLLQLQHSVSSLLPE